MPPLETADLQRLRKEIDSVHGHYFHLLSLTVLVMLVLAAGILLRVYPKLLWNLQNSESELRYLPQLLVGLFFLVGLLSCYVLEQRRRLNRTQERLVEELIRRETAERLAVIDPLTELYNRRYIMQAITREARRADRQDQKLALLMIDINGFKNANDSLGHLLGDRILREVALLLQSTFRTTDIVSRYGGDEFLILLVDAEEKEATRAIERLRYQVEQWNHAGSIAGYRMSLSCGAAVYRQGSDTVEVLATADKAMYEDKSNCRQSEKAASAPAST
ncbi:MAG: GGDEF domain-containing protein [Terriglobales bacterium]